MLAGKSRLRAAPSRARSGPIVRCFSADRAFLRSAAGNSARHPACLLACSIGDYICSLDANDPIRGARHDCRRAPRNCCQSGGDGARRWNRPARPVPIGNAETVGVHRREADSRVDADFGRRCRRDDWRGRPCRRHLCELHDRSLVARARGRRAPDRVHPNPGAMFDWRQPVQRVAGSRFGLARESLRGTEAGHEPVREHAIDFFEQHSGHFGMRGLRPMHVRAGSVIFEHEVGL